MILKGTDFTKSSRQIKKMTHTYDLIDGCHIINDGLNFLRETLLALEAKLMRTRQC